MAKSSKPSLPVIKSLKPLQPIRSLPKAKPPTTLSKRPVRPPLMPKR